MPAKHQSPRNTVKHPRRQLRRELQRAVALDAGLARVIAALGYPEPRIRAPGFATLLRIIVSQQLSTGVAAAIWSRIEKDCGGTVTHRKILRRSHGQLRGYGLSTQKAEYARDLARMIADGTLDPINFGGAVGVLDTEGVIAELIKVRGIGRWSAEIYAMFALGHRDVFPAADLALQVAVQRYAKRKTRPTEQQTADFARRWSPYRSCVAVLMWKYYGAATLD